MRQFRTQLEIYGIVLVWNMEVLIKRVVIDGCYFLVFVQESNQRKRLGGGVEAAVYRYFLNCPTLLPRLRATLPPVPLPGCVEAWVIIVIKRQVQPPTICHCHRKSRVVRG